MLHSLSFSLIFSKSIPVEFVVADVEEDDDECFCGECSGPRLVFRFGWMPFICRGRIVRRELFMKTDDLDRTESAVESSLNSIIAY